MVLSMFTVCELRVWQRVKPFSCGQHGGLMLAETYGFSPRPNPEAPQSQEGDVKGCHDCREDKLSIPLQLGFFNFMCIPR